MAALRERVQLLRGLLTGEVAYSGPFYVNMDLTRRCNLRCLGCRYHSPYAKRPSPGDQPVLDMPYELARDVVRQLRSVGTRILTFVSDGENFLYPYLFELIDFAKTNGLHVTMFTNGTLLDDATTRYVVESRLDVLRVSSWASSAEEYARSYPGANPDNLRTVADGLRLLSRWKRELRSASPHVALHRPLHRHNFEGIDDFVDLAHNTGCNGVTFSPLLVVRNELAACALSPEEEHTVRLSLTRAGKLLAFYSLSHNIEEALNRYDFVRSGAIQHCYIGWIHSGITVDGTILPCKACRVAPVGDLKKQPFHEIWNGPGYRLFRRRARALHARGSSSNNASCEFCCHVGNNSRVHRWFRWFAPFSRKVE